MRVEVKVVVHLEVVGEPHDSFVAVAVAVHRMEACLGGGSIEPGQRISPTVRTCQQAVTGKGRKSQDKVGNGGRG